VNSERLIQALTRGFVVFVTAGVLAVVGDATNIVHTGTDDTIIQQMALPFLVGIAQFVLKWIGGITVPGPVIEEPMTGRRGVAKPVSRPNVLAV